MWYPDPVFDAMHKFEVETAQARAIIDVTEPVNRVLHDAGVESGLCTVFVPHTTAGVLINENADPDVRRDMLVAFERMVPAEGDYRHDEGNSAAHVLASLVGTSATAIVEGGKLVLGTWQGVFFCEFDGPRTRTVFVKVLPG